MSWTAPDGVLASYNTTGVRHASRQAVAVWLSDAPVRYAVVASHGVWRSLVARFVRDEEVVGSNPATPTIQKTRHVRVFCMVWPGLDPRPEICAAKIVGREGRVTQKGNGSLLTSLSERRSVAIIPPPRPMKYLRR